MNQQFKIGDLAIIKCPSGYFDGRVCMIESNIIFGSMESEIGGVWIELRCWHYEVSVDGSIDCPDDPDCCLVYMAEELLPLWSTKERNSRNMEATA